MLKKLTVYFFHTVYCDLAATHLARCIHWDTVDLSPILYSDDWVNHCFPLLV